MEGEQTDRRRFWHAEQKIRGGDKLLLLWSIFGNERALTKREGEREGGTSDFLTKSCLGNKRKSTKAGRAKDKRREYTVVELKR